MSQAAQTVRTPPIAETATATAAETARGRPPYLLALAAAAAVFALYAFTLAPSTYFWDTSEYIATGHILGIPHPPGNPLFVLLARAWELLLAPTGLPTAVRINLFSAFMSAGTSFFWFLTIHRVLGFFEMRESARRVGAGVSVLVAATAYTVWSQSNVNEKVYTVSMLTVGALTWLAFLWRDHVEAHRGQKGRFNDDNAIILMVFILALAVGNHMMTLLAVPALVVFMLMVRPSALGEVQFYVVAAAIAVLGVLIGAPAMALALLLVRPRVDRAWKLYALAGLFFVFGLSVHLFLSIRSGLHPIINEAQPTCESVGSALSSIVTFGNAGCENLSAALQREQYAKPPVTQRLAPFSTQLLNYFQYFDWQWARSVAGVQGYLPGPRLFVTFLFLILGGFGAVEHYKRDRKSFAYLAVLFATLSVGLTFYMNFKYGYTQVRALGLGPELSEVRERDYFFLVSFSLWGLWAGMGITLTWVQLAESIGRKGALALASPVLALALVPLVLNWPYASRRDDYAARDLAYNLLQSVEPYGVLFTNGDNDTFPLWYLQEVEGIRRDVTVIVLSYLNTDWYPRQLRDLTAPCQRPGQALEDPTRIVCQRPFEAAGGKAPAFYDGSKAPTRSILAMTDQQIGEITDPGYVVLPQDAVFEHRGLSTVIPAGKVLQAADQFVFAIIKQAWGDRPIFFASTTNVQYDLGLYEHVARQGLAFKLVTPEEGQRLLPMPGREQYNPVLGAYMDVDRGARLLDQVFMHRGLPERAHWTDDATRNIPIHYYYAYLAQAQAEVFRNNPAASQKYEAKANAFEALSKR